MDESLATSQVAEAGECALLALLTGVLEPDPDRGISGDFGVFSQDGAFAAIALPLNNGRGEAPVLQVNDFFLPWAVGSVTTGARTVGFAWRYTDLCLALNEPRLRVELGVPTTDESIPLYLPAFRIDAPFATDECHVVNLDVSQPEFRACGYAKQGPCHRALVWSRCGGADGSVVARDVTELLSPTVRRHFDGSLGFLKDGRLEVSGEGINQPDQIEV